MDEPQQPQSLIADERAEDFERLRQWQQRIDAKVEFVRMQLQIIADNLGIDLPETHDTDAPLT